MREIYDLPMGRSNLDAPLDRLRKADLNLFTALYILIEERSVTKAAERMFITQPAMSRILDRLRKTFEDELLVRNGKRYEPTSLGSAIYEYLREILPHLAGLFPKREFKFEPSKTKYLFRIECGDIAATLLIPGLVCILSERAPGILIDVVPRRRGFQSLADNSVDLVLGREQLKEAHLRSQTLFRGRLVCLMRRGHPLSNRRLTLREYARAQHISLGPLAWSKRPHVGFLPDLWLNITRVVERKGRKTDVRVRVPYAAPVALIVGNTDLIATISPESARCLKTAKTQIVPAPKEFKGVAFMQTWHSRNDLNPIHVWMRGLIRGLARQVSKDSLSLSSANEGSILGVDVAKLNPRRIGALIRSMPSPA